MEEKCRQPASEFLQDIRSTLSRCEREKFQNPGIFSPEFKWRICESSQRNPFLESVSKAFKDTVSARLQFNKENVTLDPDTAHPKLILSVDLKSVKWEGTRKALRDNPERFDTKSCVLGCEGFTLGRHCWEVEVGDGKGWAVGVARESVQRKGEMSNNPEGGIWALGPWKGQYRAFTSPCITLSLSGNLKRIRVYLDCAAGQVAFFDADNETPIFTFPPASFCGERMLPLLWVWDARSPLRLCP
uniref:B30.2/SPRY domain-containing protein n=1 Tax=Sphenodon punctatus TaxID=8508 RepID=A0A8D0HAV4_SPHPU